MRDPIPTSHVVIVMDESTQFITRTDINRALGEVYESQAGTDRHEGRAGRRLAIGIGVLVLIWAPLAFAGPSILRWLVS